MWATGTDKYNTTKPMANKVIIFNSRDELLRMQTDKIVYFEADGNYTHIVTANKMKATLGVSLAKTEQALSAQLGEEARLFMRVGKRFIVNTRYVYSVNPAKQHLILSDMQTFALQLPVSKEALRLMKELILKNSI
jgi:DNA-binding LytR/AlgR family response regulator